MQEVEERVLSTSKRQMGVLQRRQRQLEKEHEQLLSCVDAASASKLLVTTRIRYSCAALSVCHTIPPER